jgi:microcystin degradation protein MlrC
VVKFQISAWKEDPILRIAVGGILHETNTFADGLTELAAFKIPGTFPGFLQGQEVLTALRGLGMCVGGYIAEAERLGMDLVPLIWTFALPSGTVRHAVYERLRGEFLESLRKALPVDGVLLDLHGAMVTDSCEDVEGDLLAKVREVVGPRVPVMVTLDSHANITPAMARLAEALFGYDTYPHVDNFERGQEAARLMAAAVAGRLRPVVGFRAIPMLIGLPKQCTLSGPMAEAFQLVHELERRPGILGITLAAGFPYADITHAGASVAVMADGDESLARGTAEEISRYLWERREDFRVSLTPVREAISYALRSGRGPVVLADVSDNPGGGSPCDGTVMLKELIERNVPSAVVAVIADPEAVRAAREAGAGRSATLKVGGKTDQRHGDPLILKGMVRWVGQKEYQNKGPMMTGLTINMGLAAVFVVNNVEIILTENRIQPFDAEALRCLDIEPKDRLLIGLKSAVHYRADYQELATKIFEVDTPGVTTPDLTKYPYRRVRRPIFPLDAS